MYVKPEQSPRFDLLFVYPSLLPPTIDTSTNNPLYTSNCRLFAFLPSCSKHLELNVGSFLIQHKIALFSKLFGYYNYMTILPVLIQRMWWL